MDASRLRQRAALGAIAALALGALGVLLGASAAASPRLQVYFTKGFEDAAWQKAAFDRVAKGWVAAAPPAVGKKAVVLSTITRDGKLLEARIDTSSGNEAWDKAALEAVRKAAPFPALPKTWLNTSLEVHWHFAFSK